MSKTRTWLDGYLRAWKTKHDDDVRATFTDDAEYWFHPYDSDQVRGIDAILAMWGDEEPAEPVIDLDVLIENDDLGIITGTVDYPGHTRYSNMWEVHFGPDGRATKFVEWYMSPKDAAPSDGAS